MVTGILVSTSFGSNLWQLLNAKPMHQWIQNYLLGINAINGINNGDKDTKRVLIMSDRSYHNISSTSWRNKWSYKYLFLFFLSSVQLLSAYCYKFSSGIEDTIIKGWESLQQNMAFSHSTLSDRRNTG